MNNINKKYLGLIFSIFILSLISCKKQGCMDEKANNFNENAKKDDGSCLYNSYSMEEIVVNGINCTKITGTIDESITLLASTNYLLSGRVLVSNESILTIEAGTIIYASDEGSVSYLAIQRGSKINAVGSSTKPIVFTSIKSLPSAGDWGGIVINGYAPINKGTELEAEGGKYGGTLGSDNSGNLQYVRVEFAGKPIETNIESSGFAFFGVGNATTLDYLQSFYSGGDGFEFKGGTVNLSHALSFGSLDDAFDYTYGWSGKGNLWKAQHSLGMGDNGVEGKNNESDYLASPVSNPVLTNIELIGDSSLHSTGLKLEQGTWANVDNLVVSDFYYSLEIEHDQTLLNVSNGFVMVKNVSASVFANDLLFTGSKDINGVIINQPLVDQATISGNVVIDGLGTSSQSWISGSWYRNL